MKLKAVFIAVLLLVSTSSVHAAASTTLSSTETMKAQVLGILVQQGQQIPDSASYYQTLKAKILGGSEKGATVTVEEDYLHLKVGDTFYLIHNIDPLDAIDVYYVSDPYRMPVLYIVGALFLICLMLFGGWQGIRGFVSLIASVLVIFYFFLPGILNGYSPALLSIGIASLIIVVGSYFTHGFTRTTTSAVIGMLITIVITGLIAYWSVYTARLSGYANQESGLLNLVANGKIDFVGLLLGGMLIGLLGVLYDSAIGQAVAVEELHRIGPHIPRWTIYKRALRIGREHIGALVNTLAIAYVGASLPLLLLFSNTLTSVSIEATVNKEVFAGELLRIMIGSIGLILAVPITTLIAVWIIIKKVEGTGNQAVVLKEEKALEKVEHVH
jgi:uncharacterized membrane protein